MRLRSLAVLSGLLVFACAEPEQSIDLTPKASALGAAAVSSPDPLATEVGLAVLQRGGNAVDAAVAMTLMLGFVEAPETGLGGGGFLLHYSAADRQTRFYDGRETAPLSADADRFTLLNIPVPWFAAVPTGRAVGVPGLPALLGQVYREHGALPWAELVAPAAQVARQGVPMPTRLSQQIEADFSLRLFADTRRYFRAQQSASSQRLINPPLADTLDRLAQEGASAFYRPPVSSAIIDRASRGWFWPSDLTQTDFDQYQAKQRAAVCAPYRQWRLCSVGPPSSGGIAVLQTLGMLQHFPLDRRDAEDAQAWHWILEASRLAFADRYRYLGDPDVVDVPVEALLSHDYLAERAQLIGPRAATILRHGQPQSSSATEGSAVPESPVRDGTSHLSVVDAQGNIVALTSSNEKPFGARMMAGGFVLNNQLTDFTFDAKAGFGVHPNAPGPGKRPRSSMSPVLVFNDQGEPVLVVGSRGGSRIIGYVIKTLIATLDWGLPVEQAIALPNVLYNGRTVDVEAGTPAALWSQTLRDFGHSIDVRSLTSGVHALQRYSDGWRGAADPRLKGAAQAWTPKEQES
ncbi:gamma-glutamyltransferase [Saccharospirillum sp. MSK14-1]|uniref:gamma-glutamyltransferase n=1 Tax=Saccharospirillum sp. MSK14-1 TaxID=1897632 RepID=UPI000D35258D|nr:gamma-glutamyltransferase [Saccharospirillum sp. MSK14-1]PTY36161.1 gamma-glutamyltransferase [Saccharospirillum sp. MSK14-1]